MFQLWCMHWNFPKTDIDTCSPSEIPQIPEKGMIIHTPH